MQVASGQLPESQTLRSFLSCGDEIYTIIYQHAVIPIKKYSVKGNIIIVCKEELTFFSKPSSIAKPRIKMMVVDLVIVYREMVTSSRPQLEKPTSMPLASPVGPTERRHVMQGSSSGGLPVTPCRISRTTTDSNHFTMRWYITTVSGNLKSCGEHSICKPLWPNIYVHHTYQSWSRQP